jgi:uncharacterized protein
MPGATYQVEDLDQAICQRLIRTVGMGRIASTDRALPKIVPVHCTVRGNEIIIGTIQAHKSIRIRHGDVVAFQADTYDAATFEGWSVSVIERCRAITDRVEMHELDALGFTPWTVEDGGHYVALPLRHIHGRALTRTKTPEQAMYVD